MARIVTTFGVLIGAIVSSSSAFAAGSGALAEPSSTSTEPAPQRERSTPTLFSKKTEVGGYGSVDVAYTRMFGEDGALIGLQGALLLDHRLSLGIAGYGWTNPQSGPDNAFGESRSFQTGYLGGVVRYAFLETSPVYFSVGGLIGGGAVILAPDDDDDDDDIRREDVDAFAVFQPDVTVHANLTRWMRLGVTAGYRFTAGVSRFGYDDSDVRGVVAGGQLQFGRF